MSTLREAFTINACVMVATLGIFTAGMGLGLLAIPAATAGGKYTALASVAGSINTTLGSAGGVLAGSTLAGASYGVATRCIDDDADEDSSNKNDQNIVIEQHYIAA